MTKFTSEFIASQHELAGKAITVPWQFDNNNYERFSGIVTIFAPWSDGVKAGNAQAYGDYRGALIAKIEHQGPDAAVVSQYQAEANAAYITAAANNYPAALDEIERLRGLLVDLAKSELLHVMEEISEVGYCAGWMMGLEWACMDMVKGTLSDFGLASAVDYRKKLTTLHDLCGGWWIWKDNTGPVFTPDAQIVNYKVDLP